MEKDIFVPKELSEKLKEIDFDEPCIAYYYHRSALNIISYKHNFNGNQSIETNLSAPTWEQVFKWFREKGIYSEILFKSLGIGGNIITFDEEGLEENCYLELQETYEQARENLIFELIELYEKERENKK